MAIKSNRQAKPAAPPAPKDGPGRQNSGATPAVTLMGVLTALPSRGRHEACIAA